jgi:hypothetical protein
MVELQHQRRLAASATVTVIGLGLVGVSGDSLLGAGVVLAGLLGLMVSIHRFGRLGADGGRPR